MPSNHSCVLGYFGWWLFKYLTTSDTVQILLNNNSCSITCWVLGIKLETTSLKVVLWKGSIKHSVGKKKGRLKKYWQSPVCMKYIWMIDINCQVMAARKTRTSVGKGSLARRAERLAGFMEKLLGVLWGLISAYICMAVSQEHQNWEVLIGVSLKESNGHLRVGWD